MSNSFKILLPFLACLVFANCALTPVEQLLIDQTIESYFINDRHVPGFGLTIVQDGEIIYSKGYGYRDIEKDLKTTNSTLFGLGSVTKAITSALTIKTLMGLFPERGGGVMDTPISQLNPALNFTFSDRFRTENVNFKDLLSHRHCLSQSGLSLLVGSTESGPEFAYRQRYIGQTASFRSGCFSYSNEVYGFAGEALAQLANTTFSELMTTFMREIGMQDALVVDKDYKYESDPNVNHGYYWKNDEEGNQPFNISIWQKIHVAPGGGGILASPRDMGEFLKFQLNGGRVGEVQVMTPDQLNIQYDVAERLGFGGDKNSQTDVVNGNLGYGLGVTVILVDGWKTYQHAGNFPPFRNKITFCHKQGLGIFTTANSMNHYAEGDMDMAHMMIAELLRKNFTNPNYLNIPKEFVEKMQRKELVLPPSSDFDYLLNFPEGELPLVEKSGSMGHRELNESELVGFYGHNIDGTLEIYIGEGGILSMTYGVMGLGTLEYLEGNYYKVNWTTDLLQQFWSDSGYREITFKVEFLDKVMNMFMDDRHISSFTKNNFLSSAPVVPYAPGSCSP